MKIKCDFCKTEYCLDRAPVSPVKCAVCGHTWRVVLAPRKNTWLVFIASLCALLSAIVFTVVVITHHQATHANRGPLIASVSDIVTSTDTDGTPIVTVNGVISNVSDAIYGLPDLIIVALDEHGNVLSRQKFMPSATLLDSGDSVNFSHRLSKLPAGVKKISAHLAEFQVPTGEDK